MTLNIPYCCDTLHWLSYEHISISIYVFTFHPLILFLLVFAFCFNFYIYFVFCFNFHICFPGFFILFLFIFCYQTQLRKSTASISSIGSKDPSKEVRMALHQSQEVLAMAAAAAAKGPVALPQKDVCISSFFMH